MSTLKSFAKHILNPIVMAKTISRFVATRQRPGASLGVGPYMVVAGTLGGVLATLTLTGSLHPYQAVATNIAHGLPSLLLCAHAVCSGVGLTALGIRLRREKNAERRPPKSFQKDDLNNAPSPKHKMGPDVGLRHQFNQQGLNQVQDNTPAQIGPRAIQLPQYSGSNPNNPANKGPVA